MIFNQGEATYLSDPALRMAVEKKKKAAACDVDDESTFRSKNWSKKQKIRPSGSRPHPDFNSSDIPWSQSEVGIMWKSRGETTSVFASKNKKF